MIGRLILVALLVLSTPVTAQSVKLKAHEIETLLAGNTAIGKWDGVKYRQFFGDDGSTIFAQEGSRSALGKWRVDTESDSYQSIWPRDADWEGWFVMEYAGAFYWVSKSTPPTPFRVVEGQQLVAEQSGIACQTLSGWMQGKGTDIGSLTDAKGPMQCGTSLDLSGAQSQHCAWGFPYRAAEAQAALAAFGDVISSCFENSEISQDDQLVNHPDSYNLRNFETPYGTLSLSLKDKGALQRTFIFIRTQ